MRLRSTTRPDPTRTAPMGRGRLGLGCMGILAIALVAAPAHASPDTFRRAIGNVVQGPVDIALSPFLGGIATARNAPEVSENPVGQALYAPFGWVGTTILQAGFGVLRVVSGALQMIPAVFLFPFEADLPDSMDPFAQGEILFEHDNPLADSPTWLKWVPPLTPVTMDVKLGILSEASLYESTDGH